MKKTVLFIALTALLLVAGCSTTSAPTLSTPKQKPGKYALQVIRIEVPLPDTHTTLSSYAMISDDIDSLLKNPNAVITEFPIAYAAVGETGINDQTETISAPQTYEGITDTNGVIHVVYGNETAKVGRYVEVTLKKVENDSATCDLWVFEKSLFGMKRYQLKQATETQDAVMAALPIFTGNETKTEVTLPLGPWIGMGGVTSEKVENTGSDKEKTTRIKKVSFVRVLPPKEEQ
jgi:hypothetical protein